MQPKTVIRYTATVVGLLYTIAIAVHGWRLDGVWSKVLGLLPLGLVLAFTIFDRYLWHWGPVLRMAGTPDLRGTWLGTMESEWLDAKGKMQTSSGPVALVIKQSFTHISVVLLAEQSRSYSGLARLERQPSGEFQLDYFYSNNPEIKFRGQLNNHGGSARMIIPSVRPRRFTGEYWTDRLSRGSIEVAWTSSKRVSELADAQGLSCETRKEIV